MHIEPIGVVRSPFMTLESMPIQPKGAADTLAQLIVKPHLIGGLDDLAGFSHIYVIYYFHKATRTELRVTPFMDDTQRGVFATRSPLRPSHIGLSVVELVGVEGGCVTVRGADILDGTPLLDIKPYIEAFDAVEESRSGWMRQSGEAVASKRSDSRFI